MTNIVTELEGTITAGAGHVTTIFVALTAIVGLFFAWKLIRRAIGR